MKTIFKGLKSFLVLSGLFLLCHSVSAAQEDTDQAAVQADTAAPAAQATAAPAAQDEAVSSEDTDAPDTQAQAEAAAPDEDDQADAPPPPSAKPAPRAQQEKAAPDAQDPADAPAAQDGNSLSSAQDIEDAQNADAAAAPAAQGSNAASSPSAQKFKANLKRWQSMSESDRREIRARAAFMPAQRVAELSRKYQEFHRMPEGERYKIQANYHKYKEMPQYQKENVKQRYFSFMALPERQRDWIRENVSKRRANEAMTAAAANRITAPRRLVARINTVVKRTAASDARWMDRTNRVVRPANKYEQPRKEPQAVKREVRAYDRKAGGEIKEKGRIERPVPMPQKRGYERHDHDGVQKPQ